MCIKYGLQSNILEYYSIISALRRESWVLSGNVQRVSTTHTMIAKICTVDKTSKYAYTGMLSKVIEFPNNLIEKLCYVIMI